MVACPPPAVRTMFQKIQELAVARIPRFVGNTIQASIPTSIACRVPGKSDDRPAGRQPESLAVNRVKLLRGVLPIRPEPPNPSVAPPRAWPGSTAPD